MRTLGRAKPKTQTHHYLTMDIETSTDKVYNSALLGEPNYITWCHNGIGYGVKSNDLTLWMLETFLTVEYSTYILYAHNGFGFDFKRIDWMLLSGYGYTAEFLSGKDGSIKSVTVRSGDYYWIIRDSLLLIPRKLSEVTKKFAPGNEKLTREPGFDVLPFQPDDPHDQAYAMQDSVGLYIAIGEVDRILREQFNVSIHEAPTLPGLAFRAFRLMFEPRDRTAGTLSEKYPGIGWGVAHAARESYHGGQTIAFRTDAVRDVVSIDANSMYGYVMLSNSLPTGEVKRRNGLAKDAPPNRTLCFAACNIPKGVFPLLKSKSDDGIVGNFRGVVTGWYWLFELEQQKELGATYEVVESYTWEDTTTCAARFVELCRQLRMSDYFGTVGEIAKLLANALYGKFAQQVGEFFMMLSETQPNDEAIPIYDPVRKREVEGLWNVKGEPSFQADMSHWASFITAKARCFLTHAISMVGFDKVIYCDTDSIFFERAYLGNVHTILGSAYGLFKIEKGSKEKGIPFQAIAPKAYLFVDKGYKLKIKNKGIPTNEILKQDGFARMGAVGQSVKFISGNNLSQIIKSGKTYGRRGARMMATSQSTTNGKIVNDKWYPSEADMRSIEEIRGDEQTNSHTSSYLKMYYAIILSEISERKERITNG